MCDPETCDHRFRWKIWRIAHVWLLSCMGRTTPLATPSDTCWWKSKTSLVSWGRGDLVSQVLILGLRSRSIEWKIKSQTLSNTDHPTLTVTRLQHLCNLRIQACVTRLFPHERTGSGCETKSKHNEVDWGPETKHLSLPMALICSLFFWASFPSYS